jgi:hypothetical protein
MPSALKIRPATPNDIPLIVSFIKELAEYEKLEHEVVVTEDILRNSLFGKTCHSILQKFGCAIDE